MCGVKVGQSTWARLIFVVLALAKQVWWVLRRPVSAVSPTKSDNGDNAALAAARLAYLRIWKNDSVATLEATVLATKLAASRSEQLCVRPFVQLGFMAGLAGLSPVERHYLQAARRIAEHNSHTRDIAYINYAEAYLRIGQGAWYRAQQLVDEAFSSLAKGDDLPEQETALAVQGVLSRWTGNYSNGLECAESMRASAEVYGNVEHDIWSCVLSASCLIRLGRYHDAITDLQRAVYQLSRRSEWVCELRAYAQLGHAHLHVGNMVAAATYVTRALEVLRRSNGPPMMVSALDGVVSLAHACLGLAETDAEATKVSLERVSRVLPYCTRLALIFPIARPSTMEFRARCLRLEGKLAKSNRCFRRAEQLAMKYGAATMTGPSPVLLPIAVTGSPQ